MCEDVQYSSNIVFIFCRRCSDVPARVAAYNLLIELSTTCLDNLKCVANRLVAMHHSCRPLNSKDWEVREGRREGKEAGEGGREGGGGRGEGGRDGGRKYY